MSEKATKEAVATSEELETPKPREASKTLMLGSGIGIRNEALLPGKLIGILDWYYNNLDPRSGVMSIVAREDGFPAGVVGEAHPWTASYVINLKHLFNRTCIKLEKEPRLNLVSATWLALLEVCLHETVHIGMAFADPKDHAEYLATRDDETEQAMEEMVKEVARDKLFDLAKAVDIEPPALADMGALGIWIHAKFLSDADSDMVKKSQAMLEEGLVYSDLKEDEEDYVYHKTLRSFIRHTLAPANDEGWDTDANLIQVKFVNDLGETETLAAQPVEEAEAVPADNTTAQATMATASDIAGGHVQPTFINAGTTPDVEMDTTPDQTLLEGMYDTDGFIDPDGTITMTQQQPAVAPQPLQQPLPNQPAVGGVYDTFTLPNTVMQQQQAALAANSAPTQPVAPPPLPDLKLSAETIQGCMREVYMRLYGTMFTRCGWSQNPQTGRFGFAAVDEVKKSIDIKDILDRWDAKGLIVSYITPNENNQDTEYDVDSYVCGMVYHRTRVPAFQLTLNIGGQRVVRKLIAQNPDKIVSNAYTKGAEMAAVGNAIAYVFSNADQKQPWHVRCPAKIVNNDYQVQTAS